MPHALSSSGHFGRNRLYLPACSSSSCQLMHMYTASRPTYGWTARWLQSTPPTRLKSVWPLLILIVHDGKHDDVVRIVILVSLFRTGMGQLTTGYMCFHPTAMLLIVQEVKLLIWSLTSLKLIYTLLLDMPSTFCKQILCLIDNIMQVHI